MALKFYMTPGSCSTGIHVLLEILELPFEAWILNLPAGEHRRPEYLALNPKGTIPTLVLDDGSALCDFQAIALYLARRWPRAGLLADEPLAAARALELMNDAVATLHGQGWTRVFTPEAYLPPDLAATLDAAQRSTWLQAVQAQGRQLVTQGYERLEARLPEQGWAGGERFGIADAALLYVLFWAERTGLPLPPRCAAYHQRQRAHPVVSRVLREEGYR